MANICKNLQKRIILIKYCQIFAKICEKKVNLAEYLPKFEKKVVKNEWKSLVFVVGF